jgi:hypothetical protein
MRARTRTGTDDGGVKSDVIALGGMIPGGWASFTLSGFQDHPFIGLLIVLMTCPIGSWTTWTCARPDGCVGRDRSHDITSHETMTCESGLT